MHDIYVTAKRDAGYNAKVFLQMLHERGGLATAKYLINATQPSEGYTRLYERGRLDLTVEARVIDNPKWHPLFTDDEIAKARERLKAYGYRPDR
ncbi:hypothetical protein ABGN05_25855 [Aquibium sp. LZ166]|uniref:Uncharacterized protein n=2 Tax=Aquibium pacificus TaxID=3153579 RepID=A0ABV3SRH8_9HYPH